MVIIGEKKPPLNWLEHNPKPNRPEMDKQVKIAVLMLMWCFVLVAAAGSFSFARNVALEYKRPLKPRVYVIPDADGLKAIEYPDGTFQVAPGRGRGSYQFQPTDEG